MSTANLGWSVNDREVLASFQKVQVEIEKLKRKNAELEEAGKRAGKQGKSSMDGWVSSIAGAVAGYVSLSAVIGVVTEDLRAQAAAQERAAMSQRTAADTQLQFLRNLGIVSSAERKKALDDIAAISSRTGVTQKDLFFAASTAMSAKGGGTVADAMAAVEQAAKVAPESPTEMATFAGALLDVQALTKSKDTRQNLGFLVGMQQQARTTSLSQVGQNLVPGAIGVAGFGGTPQESAALLTTMTQAMKDPTGAVAATSAISLAEQLEKFKPLKGFKETDERIRLLQENAKLREQFLKQASFEKKAVIPVRELLTAGTETATLFERNIKGIPSGTAAGQLGQEFVAGIGATELQQASTFQRRTEQQAENMDLAAFRSGDVARIRERTNVLLAGTGASPQDYSFTIGRMVGEQPLDTAESILARRAHELRTFGRGGFIGDKPGSPQAQENKVLADKLDAVVAELQKLNGKVPKGPAKAINQNIE